MNRKLNFLGIALLGALLLQGCASGENATAAGDAKAGETFTLRHKVNVGDEFRQDISISFAADLSAMPADQKQAMGAALEGEQGGTLTGTNLRKVTKVEGGNITIETSVSEPKFEGKGIFAMAEAQMKDSLARTQTITFSELGLPVGDANTNLPGPMFPEKAVKVGDTWEVELKGSEGAEPIKVTGKLVGVEEVAGKKAVRIEYTGYTAQGATSDGPIVMLVDPTNGQPLSLTAKMNADMGGMKMTMDIKATSK